MGAPVVGHLGFKPQSSLQVSSVVQGKTAKAASRLFQEARELEAAGCISLVLEAVTSDVASHITEELSIPTIGIGAGAGCVGQVLVWHDLVGLTTPGRKPLRFVKRYADSRALFSEAARSFADEVHSGAFPTEEHGWVMSEAELEEWRARENGR
jgi:3-methyl-2-oxobutanoate hydroxymethyltransferase